jgi:choline kinase
MHYKMSQSFTALILAAGSGSRINSLTAAPKSLLPIAKETILQRHFRIWKEAGIKKAVVVVGYRSEMIIHALEKHHGDFDIRFVMNADHERLGNTYSLYVGLQEIDQNVAIFDADLVYDEQILLDFLTDHNKDQILIGEGSLDDEECTKTLLDDDGMVRMTIEKRYLTSDELNEFHFGGEATGILKFSYETVSKLKDKAERFLSHESNRGLNWEHLMNEFLAEHSMAAHKIRAGRWIEIDTPHDYHLARRMFEE